MGRRIWRILYPVLTHIVIYMLVLFGAAVVISTINPQLSMNDTLTKYAALITIITLVITIPIEFLYYRRDYVLHTSFIFKKPQYLIAAIIVGLLVSHGLSILISLINSGGALGTYTEVEQVIYSSDMPLVILRAVILAPLCEELIFRGLTFKRMREDANFWVSAVISSAIFALYHMNVPQGIFAFLYGMLLCLLYDMFGNLWVPIIVHAAGNLLSIVLTYTHAGYPALWIYILVMVITLGLAFIIYFFVLKKGGKAAAAELRQMQKKVDEIKRGIE